MKRYLVICEDEETCPQCKGRSVPHDPKDSRLSSCVECKGEGVIRKEVELVEAIRELGRTSDSQTKNTPFKAGPVEYQQVFNKS